jgi:hypothetical protein
LIAERSRVLDDIENIAKGIEHMQGLAAARQITSDYADSVIAQCRDEHRMLSDRLSLLDAAIAENTKR